MIKWSASKDGEQYPAHGASERGRTVRVPRRRGGKALPSPGRKWPGGPRRYRARARAPGREFRWDRGQEEARNKGL